MKEPGIAVKAFIVNEKKEVLILRRRKDDVHRPGTWDIPGGRLNQGESPFDGMKREVKEETNLEIEVKSPLQIHYFTREDGQQITMIVFLCRPLSKNIKLSEEHMEYRWVDTDKFPAAGLDTRFEETGKIFLEHFS